MKKQIGRLHVITDVVVQDRFTHAKLAGLAVAGGAGTIQFRDKILGTREAIDMARTLKRICDGAGVPFIVNDRVDIAMAVDADGVHLGRDDLPLKTARKLLGPDKIIGGTAGTIEDALLAREEGADYIGFGHIFPTQSKDKLSPPVGLESLREVCSRIDIPVIAIGGITRQNVEQVIMAGAFGAAVIGAVCAQDDPEAAATGLASSIEKALDRWKGKNRLDSF
jgi:thiamine-phosphate pyrophosphorylase